MILSLLLLALLLLQNSPLSIWRDGSSYTDSSVFQTIALQMTKGYMPYRDTFDHKGPLLYLLNWLGMSISYLRGVWVIELIMDFTAFLFMYRTARLCCGKWMSLCCVLAGISLLFVYFSGGNLVEEYAMVFIAAALYIFLGYFLNNKITKIRLMACGFSFGAVCLLRPNMIAVWCVFCIAVLVQCVSGKCWKRLTGFIGFFLIGMAIIVVPILLWLLLNHAFVPFWQDYIEFNMIYTASGDSSFPVKCKVFLDFAKETEVLLAVLGCVFLCCTKRIFLGVSYFMYLFITLVLICISGLPYLHYGMVLVPVVVFPIAVLAGTCEKAGRKNGAWIVLALCLAGVMIVPDWIKHLAVGKYYANGSENSLTQEICDFIDMNTSEEEHISVYGNHNMFYVYSSRLPATRYSYQIPPGQVKPSILDEYFEELSEELPKLMIFYIKNGKFEYESDRIQEFLYENGYSVATRYDHGWGNEWVIYWR